MRIIGITGGTGSGKSVVAQVLRDLGAKVIDADILAREVVKPGEPALKEIIDTFGMKILTNNGELDRKALADIVFNDKEKVAVLNAITHKYIVDRIIDIIAKEQISGRFDTIVIDVPIPVKRGFLDTAEEIWVITAARETRIERVMQRSGLTREEAEKRIESQMRDDEYNQLGHHIIENDLSIEELEQKVVKLYLQAKSNNH